MSKTVGKTKSTNTSKATKKAVAKAPKTKTKTKAVPKTSPEMSFKNLKVDSNSKVLLICVAAIVIILVIALLASAIKNKKTDIDADMNIYASSDSCAMIVREDDGKRPASGSTIVVKDSKQFRDMLSQYSYLKKFNLPEPKDFSDASYVYVFAMDSVAEEAFRLGDVSVQNKNVNIEVKYDARKSVDCVLNHVFVIRINDKNVENANFSTIID